MNTRYQVGPHDRVLALSALHFDLSVYDIFGVLRAGGALVMVMENQRRDPHAWCELIQRHQVTLWNSVPALFDMLLTWCEGFADATPENLRAVMLSGDWIGTVLVGSIRDKARLDEVFDKDMFRLLSVSFHGTEHFSCRYCIHCRIGQIFL